MLQRVVSLLDLGPGHPKWSSRVSWAGEQAGGEAERKCSRFWGGVVSPLLLWRLGS